MNKKIILLVAVLLIVAIVFVACKGKNDAEETTESTTETTESTSVNIELDDMSDGDFDMGIIPEVYDENETVDMDNVIVIGGQENATGEDSISWNEVVGKNS